LASVDDEHRLPLGVLFVHGIGNQKRGETLVRFTDPLLDWFRNTIPRSRDNRRTAEVRGAKLNRTLDSDQPAHVRLELPRSDGGTETWLLAESWWAEEFVPPAFKGMATWLLPLVPRLVIGQAATILSRVRRSEEGRFLRARHSIPPLLLFVLSIPFALLSFLLLVVLLILSVLPLPFIKRGITGVALSLSGSIGDSFALVASRTRFSSMVNRVTSDIDWLAQRSESVAIIAHSQGAAIAHEAIRETLQARTDRGDRGDIKLFAMLGSGLRKLHTLKEPSKVTKPIWGLTVLGLITAVIVTWGLLRASGAPFVVGASDTQSLLDSNWYTISTILIFTCIAFGGRIVDSYDEILEAKRSLPLTGPGSENIRWVEYFATADMVPNGPTFEKVSETEPERLLKPSRKAINDLVKALEKESRRPQPRAKRLKDMETRLTAHRLELQDLEGKVSSLRDDPSGCFAECLKVHNRASPLKDHTSYLTNTDEIVTELATELLGVRGAEACVAAPSPAQRQRFRANRERRVRWLVRGRALILVAAGLSYIASFPAMRRLSVQWLEVAPEPLIGSLKIIGAPLAPLLAPLHNYAAGAIALTTLTAITLLTYGVVLLMWRLWDAKVQTVVESRAARFSWWQIPFFFAALVILAVACWQVRELAGVERRGEVLDGLKAISLHYGPPILTLVFVGVLNWAPFMRYFGSLGRSV
jgi:hypothetical protein